MNETSEPAGVSKALVYLYLNSKEELFSVRIRREAAALRDAVWGGAGGAVVNLPPTVNSGTGYQRLRRCPMW
ncbi:hypothetical protein GCM10010349_69590 [Streptomyces flavofungini]|nr:hypothetical protein GCM10010349_69590 [Streptomyces flavofungini]